MTLLSAIVEKLAAWRRDRRAARKPSDFSDHDSGGFRYWTV
jgi:hypothetical protein